MKPYINLSKLFTAMVFGLLMLTGCMKEEVVTPLDNESVEVRNTTPSSLTSTPIIGLSTNNELVTYKAGPPAQVVSTVSITGLKTNESIKAIDFRPATKDLYGVSNLSNLYLIDFASGFAKLVSATPLSPAVNGSIAGFDFNPRTDRIRIVTDLGQNLTVSPVTGRVTSIDVNINPATTKINSIAYTTGGSTTLPFLYDLSMGDGYLYSQSDAKGTLRAIGYTGLQIAGEGGFDIAKDNSFAVAFLNAYAPKGIQYGDDKSDDITQLGYRLYVVDLRTGGATSFGKVDPMIGIAIQH